MTLSPERTRSLFRSFSDLRVLVVGDVMLDHYIWGQVERISPEAPVPVVQVSSESRMPGGAANVVNNLSALGVACGIVGITGNDASGQYILNVFREKGIACEGLLFADEHPTIEKVRIIAHSQQVVRFDREKKSPISKKDRESLLKKIRTLAPFYDAVILEDYGKGAIDQSVADCVLGIKKKKPSLLVAYDPKKGHLLKIRNIDLGTPNFSEAVSVVDTRADKTIPLSIDIAGKLLRKAWGARALFVTLGEKGMMVFEKGKVPFHIPTVAREVYDVSGAGDTVIATASAALAAGAGPREAAILSNAAAGVVVGKLGTQTASAEEILSMLRQSA